MMVNSSSNNNSAFNCFHLKYVDWIALLSASLAFCIYLNTLNAGFVYDDSRAILTNKDVLQQETPWQEIWKDDFWGTPLTHSGSHKSFRPLTILSFRMNRCFSGFNPWSYHLTNVILHSLATWLFVRVARVVFNLSACSNFHYHYRHSNQNEDGNGGSNCWTTNQNMALLVAALLFASHPIHTEAVAGVVGRADVAATAFALSSFLMYTSHVKSRNRHKIVATSTFCQCEGGGSTRNGVVMNGNGGMMKQQQQQQSVKSLDNGYSISSKNNVGSSSLLHFSTMAYFVISILLAGVALLCKEHGIMVLFICAIYDVILSLIRYRRSQVKLKSFRELECSGSVFLLGLSFVALFNLRLSVMGGLSTPQFAKADNPTAHHPSLWVRTLTFLFLPIFNLSLFLYPHPLSYDWSMDSVPRIEKLGDPRNLLTLLFYASLCRRIYHSARALKVNASLNPDVDVQFKATSPLKISCKICRFSIANHKCSNNNSIVIPSELEDGGGSGSGGKNFGNSINNTTNYGQSQQHHHHGHNHSSTLSTPSSSKIISSSSKTWGMMTSLKNGGGPSSSNGNNGKYNYNSNNTSISPQRHTQSHAAFHTSSSSTTTITKSWSGPVWHCSSSSLEHGALLLQLGFLVLPFLPASNLFLYVGFVVAERVLYFPSVGFCLLVGHGFSQLYSRTERLRRGGSFIKAFLVAAFIAAVVMMSLGTIRRNEDWRDEGRLYRAGIAVNPPKSWGNLGNVLNSQGRVAEAEEAYRQALRFRPNMAEVHYNLGLVLERQGKVEEALASYRTAIHVRQQLASAYVNAGQLLTRLGRINQAMDMYRKCFNLNDEGVKDLRTHIEAKVSALIRFGKLLIEIEDAPKAAVNVYRQAVRIMPSDYEQKQSVYNAIGEALFRIGEITEAESWFLEALKTKPDHVPAHLTYGKMLARNKTRLLEAERWFRRAKKIAPQDSSVYHHYGQFLAVQGRHSEAAVAYVTAATLSPNDYDIVVGAANALRQSGNNKEAEVYYEKAVALRSQEARAHMNLGAILHVNGKYHEAEQSYLMALRLKPSDDVTLLNLKKLRQLQARRNQYAMSCKNKKQQVPQIQQQQQVIRTDQSS